MKRFFRNLLESRSVFIKRYHNCPGVDWGLDVKRALSKFECKTLFDVGANVGQTVEFMLRRFPGSVIHSFEPSRKTYDNLVLNYGRNPIVNCYNLAFSDHVGHQRLFIGVDSQQSSLEANALADTMVAGEEEVEVQTIDEFCRRHRIERIDVLKTDTEGHDMLVLAGANDLIGASRIRAIYLEVGTSPLDKQHTNFFTAYEWLIARGYRFMGLYELGHFQNGPLVGAYCNALFVLANEISQPS